MEKDFTPENIPYELILGEQEGILSAEQDKVLQEWKNLSDQNLEAYEQTLEMFLETDLLKVRKNVDIQKSWESFSKNLDQKQLKVKKAKILNVSRFWWSAAAILLISIAITMQLGKSASIEVRTGSNERRHFVFPDGSEAILNQNTAFAYQPEQFSKARELVLKQGEAYFTVKHDSKNPFSIRAGALQVEDLGTSFNVRMTDKKIAVSVNSGEVAIARAGHTGSKVLLNPRDKAVYDLGKEKIEKAENQLNNDRAWVDSTFNYQQAQLQEVAREIGEVYHVKISFKDERLKKRRLSAYFKAKRIEDIMLIISKTLNIKAVKVSNGYLFTL